MKKLWAYMLAVLVLIGALSGCASDASQEKEPETTPEIEQPEKIEEPAELEMPEEPAPPTIEELEAAYFAAVADRPLYNDFLHEPGVAAAEMVDFNGDGLNELLLLSVDSLDILEDGYFEYGVLKFEVFGFQDGEVIKYGENSLDVYPDGGHASFYIKLFQKDGQTYVGTYSQGGGNASPAHYVYYEIENQALTLKEHLMNYSMQETYNDGVDVRRVMYYLHSFEEITYDALSDAEPTEEAISEEEYTKILGSYAEVGTVATYSLSVLSFAESYSNNNLMARFEEQARENEYKINVNGTLVESDLLPVAIDGEIFVPLESTLESIGAVVFEDEMQTAMLTENTGDGAKALFAITKSSMMEYFIYGFDSGIVLRTKGEGVENRGRIIEGQYYIALNYIPEAFPVEISVDEASKTIGITSTIPAADIADDEYVNQMMAFSVEEAERILTQNGYTVYSDYWAFYEDGKSWISFYVFALDSTTEQIAADTAEVGSVSVAHDGTMTPYEHIGNTDDLFW